MLIAIVFALPTRNIIRRLTDALSNIKAKAFALPYSVFSDLVYIGALVSCIAFVIGGSYNPFLYFRF